MTGTSHQIAPFDCKAHLAPHTRQYPNAPGATRKSLVIRKRPPFLFNSAICSFSRSLFSRFVLFLHLSETIYKWSWTRFGWEDQVAKWKEKPSVALIASVPMP